MERLNKFLTENYFWTFYSTFYDKYNSFQINYKILKKPNLVIR